MLRKEACRDQDNAANLVIVNLFFKYDEYEADVPGINYTVLPFSAMPA